MSRWGLTEYKKKHPGRLVYDCCQNPETRPRMSNSNGVMQTLTSGSSSLWSVSKNRLIRVGLKTLSVWFLEPAPCNILYCNSFAAGFIRAPLPVAWEYVITCYCHINWDGMELLYVHGLPVERKTAMRLGLETMKTGKLSHSAMCTLYSFSSWRLGCWEKHFSGYLDTKKQYRRWDSYYYAKIPHPLIVSFLLVQLSWYYLHWHIPQLVCTT